MVVILTTLVVAEPASAAESKITIVAMGDSYTAGTGGLNYFGPSGCYRSGNNYTQVLANKIKWTGVGVDYYNLACNAAVTSDLTNQVNSLSYRQRQAVDLVLLTIGGNDGDFQNVVKNCFVGITDDGDKCNQSINDGYDKAGTIKSKVTYRLEELAVLVPNAKIVLLGYPYPVAEGNDSCLYMQTTSSGYEYSAGERIRGLADLLESAQIQAVNQLNQEYKSRFRFVSVKNLFKDHEICGSKEYWLRDTLETFVISEWWHPNKEGYQAEGNYLYNLGIHNALIDTFLYSNLPLACGVSVKYASTYDSIVVNGKTYYHNKAIDLPVPSGTRLVAPESGTAYSYNDPDGYGYYVQINADSGYMYRLAHMQASARPVSGSRVAQGQFVGYSGSSGVVTGPHLHFERWRSGEQVNHRLGGPALEWGPNLDSRGSRITEHTLESGNCGDGNAATSTGGSASYSYGNELLFHNPSTGRALFYDVETNGSTHEYSNHKWGRGWDIAVELEFDGDKSSELLLYNRHDSDTRGRVSFYDMSANGLSGALTSYRWSNYWSHIVPIDIDGDRLDEVLVYSKSNGRYYFIDISRNGQTKVINSGTWSLNWQHIVALEFDGTRGDELLFYKPGTDRAFALFYDVNSSGYIYRKNRVNWVNGWTHIVPINLDSESRDEVIVYREKDGRYYFIDLDSNAGTKELRAGNWKTGWNHIIPLEVVDNGSEELLFYDDDYDSRAVAALYTTTKSGLNTRLVRYNWSLGWDFIIPVQVD